MRVPLIAMEVFLGFIAPLGWAIWELVSLRRDRRRQAERQESDGTTPSAPPDG